MTVDIRDNFNVESFYQWLEETSEEFPIPVQCDDNPELCSDCVSNDAVVEVWYRRNGINFWQKLCNECYNDPDYQAWMKTAEIVKITLL